MSFVRDQLDLLDSMIKVQHKGEYALVQCPFHKDGQETHPSLMVNLENPKYPEGFHYCLSCGTKGDWNTLAEVLGLEVQTEAAVSISKLRIKPLKMKDPLEKKDKSISLTWSPSDSWRGIDGKVLSKLKARLRLDSFTKEKQVDIPVNFLGKTVGHIYCSLNKKPKDQGSSYINSPGPWVKKVLFPLDLAIELLREGKVSLPICIVEGPRDALNLIQYGLPAVAILGCTNWSKHVLSILATLRVSNFVVLMDGDAAGQAAANIIYGDLVEHLPKDIIKICKLPQDKDPADLTKVQVDWLLKTYG